VPVIGRLDGQVEEILIKPVGGRGRADEETAPAPGEVPERRAPPATPATAGDERTQTPREDRRARRANPLPVWLL